MTTPNKDDMLNKVRALLAKAEGTDSDHEAEALTAKAAELMAKYGIDEAMATQRAGHRAKPGSKIVLVDAPYAVPKASLLNIVAKAFRCRAVQLPSRADKTQLKVHLFGFESDMGLVEILFTSLLLQASHGAVRVEKQTDYYGRSRTRSARSSYIMGFAAAVQGRLATVKAEAEASVPGAELVLVGRDVAVQDEMRREYPRLRSVSVSASNASGYGRGHADGMRANLHNRSGVGSGGRALSR